MTRFLGRVSSFASFFLNRGKNAYSAVSHLSCHCKNASSKLYFLIKMCCLLIRVLEWFKRLENIMLVRQHEDSDSQMGQPKAFLV